MLTKIIIRNMAVIKELEIDLGNGLNVITGVTGAGKSMIIDALTLLCGGRASSDVVRTGEEWCEVQGVFNFKEMPESLKRSFIEHDIPVEDEMIIRRLVQKEGRSRAYVNGVIVNLTYLQEQLGGIVSILSQHEQQKLFDPAFQLELLDRFLENTEKVEDLENTYKELRILRSRLDEMKKMQADAAKRADYLRYQISDIKEHGFKSGEEDELNNRVCRADHSVMVLRALNSIVDATTDGDASASERLTRLVPELSKCATVEPDVEKLLNILNDAVIKIEELSKEASCISKRYDLDPAQIEEDKERFSELKRLKKKFASDSLDGILKVLEDMEKELNSLENVDSQLSDLEAEISRVNSEYMSKAKIISELRKKGSSKLSSMIESILDSLGIFKGGFKVHFKEVEASSRGMDRVDYLITTNKGEEAKPISKIASGGELSRLMLAVQSATNEVYGYGIQVFDEVDAGIGGDVGFKVGGLLKGISSNHQIIVITHLPQIAVFGTRHLSVWKEEHNSRTEVRIETLDKEGRFNEITRMLGMENHKVAVSNAKEMLAKAQGIRPDVV